MKQDAELCKSIDEALAAVQASLKGGLDMATLLQKANKHVQSEAFINTLCNKMFRSSTEDSPPFVYSERLMRKLFADWRENLTVTPAFFAHFIADIVYKSISKYLRESIYNGIRSNKKKKRRQTPCERVIITVKETYMKVTLFITGETSIGAARHAGGGVRDALGCAACVYAALLLVCSGVPHDLRRVVRGPKSVHFFAATQTHVVPRRRSASRAARYRVPADNRDVRRERSAAVAPVPRERGALPFVACCVLGLKQHRQQRHAARANSSTHRRRCL